MRAFNGQFRTICALCQAGAIGYIILFTPWLSVSHAQVTTNITASDLTTTVVQDTTTPTTWNIRGGTLSSGETNLFHSFGDLSIAQGDTALFQNLNAAGDTSLTTNAGNVSNIIGRVTGGNPSNIFGAIDSQTGFPNANLFLINPAGIVFGPGASLNVGGSVHVSTADYLRLGTSNELFYADLARNSTLSSAPVTAFGFLGSNPIAAQAIEVQGNLSLTGSNSLSLIGRDIGSGPTAVPGLTIVGGRISNPGGRINLVSVGTPLDPTAGGEVSATDFSPASSSSGHSFATLGNILLANNAQITAGKIVIRGGQLTMEGRLQEEVDGPPGVVDGPVLHTVTTDANSTQSGIDINVSGAMTLRLGSTITNATSAAIPGSDILIRAGSLTVTDGSQIMTTNESGNANSLGGSIDVTADTVLLSGAIDGGGDTVQSGLVAGTTRTSAGPAGRIHVIANELSILDGAAIDTSTFSGTDAGDIAITAPRILVSGVNTTNGVTSPSSAISSRATWDRQADNPNQEQQNTGNAGNINIQTTHLDIRDGGQLTTSSETAGDAGSINVTADAITITGGFGNSRSGISSETKLSGSGGTAGTGGDVTLTVGSYIDLSNGAKIALDTVGDGPAGTLNVNAGRISLAGGSQITSETISSGAAGNLSLRAGSLIVQDSVISTRSFGSGNAGAIAISAENVTVTGPTARIDSSTNTSSSIAGAGGNVVVTASNTLSVQGGKITTSTASLGNGGTLQVSANQIRLSDRGEISSSTSRAAAGGNGGTVSVAGTGPIGSVQLTGGSSIKAATTGDGNAGDIIVTGNTVSVSGAASAIDSSTSGSGSAGRVNVNADQVVLSGGGTISSSTRSAGAGGTVSVAGTGPTGSVQLSGGSITAATTGSGNAGNISVSGNTVTLSGTASSIDSSTTGSGNAGNIHVQAGQVNLENGGTISSASVAPATGNAGSVTVSTSGQFQSTGGTVTTSADNGQGGDITIRSNEILLNSGASVTASTTGPLDAGDIRLVAADRIMLQDSTVTTEASRASGGNITLLAPNLIRLRNGQIISSVQGGTGTSGGDITIDPQAVLLQNNSQILAQAFLGNGGNISITAGVLIVEPGSTIDATSQLGVSGQVSVQAPIQSLAGVVNPLPQSFVNNANLYAQHCAANKGGQFSSFVQGARDGVPPQPGDFLSSPLPWNMMTRSPALSNGSSRPTLMEVRLGFARLSVSDTPRYSYPSRCTS